MMTKLSAMIGEVSAPVLFMVFVGYQIGQHSGKMALSMVLSVLLGFCVAVVNVWKSMKKLGRKDD